MDAGLWNRKKTINCFLIKTIVGGKYDDDEKKSSKIFFPTVLYAVSRHIIIYLIWRIYIKDMNRGQKDIV